MSCDRALTVRCPGSLVLVLAVLLAAAAGVAAQRGTSSPPEGAKVHRNMEYVKDGHERNKLDLYLPEKADGPLPVIVWIHGGAWSAGSKDNPGQALAFVRKGYAVASIGYRLSQHATFPAQIEDCKAAIRWLRANARTYRLDPDHIGVWGASAGGHLVALLGTTGGVRELEGKGGNAEQSSRVQAVVDFFGPTDFLQMDAHAVKGARLKHDPPNSPESRLIGAAIQENVEKVQRANPIHYVTKDAPPLLIVHGEQDPLVPCHQSELLYEALKKAGSDVAFYKIAGAGHGGPEFNTDMMRAAVQAFFDRHLKPRSADKARTPPRPKGGKAEQPTSLPADYDDYRNMLDQLGVNKMRRGRDARVKDTSDEATANPYKDSMPDLMTLKDGKKVKSADQWPKRNRLPQADFLAAASRFWTDVSRSHRWPMRRMTIPHTGPQVVPGGRDGCNGGSDCNDFDDAAPAPRTAQPTPASRLFIDHRAGSCARIGREEAISYLTTRSPGLPPKRGTIQLYYGYGKVTKWLSRKSCKHADRLRRCGSRVESRGGSTHARPARG